MAKPGSKPLPLADRIARRIKIGDSGCWIWQGYRNGWGYGRMGISGRLVLVHRVSYEVHTGPIPSGLHVLHRCDNPACCNPDHLFLGTLSDNVQDAIAKGRHRVPIGEASPSAKLTTEAVREIRETAYRLATISELSRRFGVCRRTIRDAFNGQTWAQV